MTTKDALLKELDAAPEPMLREVLDFIGFLKIRQTPGAMQTAIASESSLATDWLKPEEDEAWKDL